MKNVYVLPTDKPSRLQKFTDVDKIEFELASKDEIFNGINIYITNSKEIKVGNWFLNTLNNTIDKCEDIISEKNVNLSNWVEEIIITTDQDLIADGVQSIPDEFLEWFVKNPSCEEVEVEMNQGRYYDYGGNVHIINAYKIIIPKEEPKQELERGVEMTQVEKKSAVDWLKPQIELMLMDGHKPYPNQLEEAFEIAKDLENQKQGYSEEDMIRFANLYSDIDINESHLKYFNNLPKFKNK